MTLEEQKAAIERQIAERDAETESKKKRAAVRVLFTGFYVYICFWLLVAGILMLKGCRF